MTYKNASIVIKGYLCPQTIDLKGKVIRVLVQSQGVELELIIKKEDKYFDLTQNILMHCRKLEIVDGVVVNHAWAFNCSLGVYVYEKNETSNKFFTYSLVIEDANIIDEDIGSAEDRWATL